MSDVVVAETYAATAKSPITAGGYSGAVSLFNDNSGVALNLYKDANVTVYDCGKDQVLTLSTNSSLTLQIVQTGAQVSVSFSLYTSLNADVTRCDGTVGSYSAGLAVTGDFTLKATSTNYCDAVQSACNYISRCGSSDSVSTSGTKLTLSTSGMVVNATSSLWFSDGDHSGSGSLILDKNATSLFSGGSVDGHDAASTPGAGLGVYALSATLAGEQEAADPFAGLSSADAAILKTIIGATGGMEANVSEAQALKSTLAATLGGVQLAIDYTGKSLTLANLQPKGLALASGSDGGAKGDGLTNDRTVQIDGKAAAGSTVSIFDGSKLVASGKAGADGAFHLTTTTLSDGAHDLSASAVDAAGVKAVGSETLSLTIDSKTLAPTIGAVTAQGLSGMAEAGAKVTIYDGLKAIGTTTAGADGAWSLAYSVTGAGAHSFGGVASDAAGNTATSTGYTLFNAAAKATVTGTLGADVLVAGADQTLTGGSGSDLFVFEGAFGKATITDFRPGTDDIRLDSDLVGSFAEVKSHAVQKGYDVVITLDDTHTLTLKSVSLSSLSANDFSFG